MSVCLSVPRPSTTGYATYDDRRAAMVPVRVLRPRRDPLVPSLDQRPRPMSGGPLSPGASIGTVLLLWGPYIQYAAHVPGVLVRRELLTTRV